jgi:hypothetical protein
MCAAALTLGESWPGKEQNRYQTKDPKTRISL